MAKYIAKQNQLEMVAEEDVEDYFESVIFDDGEAELSEIETIDEEKQKELIERIYKFDKVIAWTLLILSVFLLIPKVIQSTPLYYILIPCSMWLISHSIGSILNGGKMFSELSIYAHATRWGLPLFLWLKIFNDKHKNKELLEKISINILIVCASLTFAIHGWEAWSLNPPFQDLIYGFGQIFNIQIPVNTIHVLLKSIGCMDIILAVVILFYRNPKIFIWMTFWGFITALSRPLTMGIEAWPEFAMRIANPGIPFILFYIYYRKQNKVNEQKKTEEGPHEDT